MILAKGKNRPEFRVKHVAFVSKTLIPGEGEFLFAPYSAFKLQSVKWSTQVRKPHKITARSMIDNKVEDEHMPLAPWY